jgi:GGDEF domain-containing protein
MMAPRRYAETTKVPVEKSIADIRSTVGRYGGEQFVYGLGEDQALVAFSSAGRQVRFYISMKDRAEQDRRQAMRALLLVIKAKLEAVASRVVLFEDEFLANIVLPTGALVGHEVRRQIANAYETGNTPALLPDYSA